jgi:rod shape-determining protein MreD
MAISFSDKRKLTEIGLSIAVIYGAWILQLTVLSAIALKDVICSLPLTMTIVWGAVFGSRLPALTPSEMRESSLSDVILRQSVAGSISGALIGAAFAALYASVIPTYPLYLPIIGWISGYFCLKNFSNASFLIIPLVFLATILAETMMAGQLALLGLLWPDSWHYLVADVLKNLVQIAVPEASINAIIAPLVFFPLRGWYEFAKAHLAVAEGST